MAKILRGETPNPDSYDIESRPHRHRRMDDGRAFMPDVEPGYAKSQDSLAENLAEAFLESATSGEERGEVLMNEFVPDDIGGPFLEEVDPDDNED